MEVKAETHVLHCTLLVGKKCEFNLHRVFDQTITIVFNHLRSEDLDMIFQVARRLERQGELQEQERRTKKCTRQRKYSRVATMIDAGGFQARSPNDILITSQPDKLVCPRIEQKRDKHVIGPLTTHIAYSTCGCT